VSFLLAEGHAGADGYALGYLWVEATIARQRANAQIATQATLAYQAAAAAQGGKDAHAALIKTLKELTDG
jgi:hypothetical protein